MKACVSNVISSTRVGLSISKNQLLSIDEFGTAVKIKGLDLITLEM